MAPSVRIDDDGELGWVRYVIGPNSLDRTSGGGEMSLRAFVDSGGNEWQVFDVVLRSNERRNQERRALEAAEATADRRGGDRRLTIGDLSRLSTISEGWLCFEREADRRRLSPIPRDWNQCSDAALEGYCRRAQPVRRLRAEIASH